MARWTARLKSWMTGLCGFLDWTGLIEQYQNTHPGIQVPGVARLGDLPCWMPRGAVIGGKGAGCD